MCGRERERDLNSKNICKRERRVERGEWRVESGERRERRERSDAKAF